MFGIIYLARSQSFFCPFSDGLFSRAWSMKNIRLLLLLGVGIMLAVVALDFLDSRQTQTNVKLSELAAIPSELSSQSSRWSWSQSSGGDRKIEIFAESVRQTKDTFLLELEGVELKIFDESGESYDHVLSGRAEFDSKSETLYSEGEVILALGLSLQDKSSVDKSPTRIRSSGVTFESKTGFAGRNATPNMNLKGHWALRRRRLRFNPSLFADGKRSVHGAGHDSPRPSRASNSAGQIFYDEKAQRIDLKGGVTLRQGPCEVQSTEAGIYLESGTVRRIEATEARGVDRHQQREIRFGAQRLTLLYNERRLLERALGNGSAELDSASPSSQIHARGERIDLSYVTLPGASESVLQEADVRERARVEVVPVAGGGEQADDIRSVTAEWIHLTMRQGGQEIEWLETLTPGTLEITPRTLNRWKRRLVATRITAHYGPGNRMDKLQALGNVEVENHTSGSPGRLGDPFGPLRASAHVERELRG